VKFTHATLRVRPDQVQRYEETFRELRATTLANEAGCLFLEACRDPADAGTYHVFEAYADAAAVKAHTETSYYARTADIFVECIDGEHMREIRARGLTGFAMYSVIENIGFERFETI
jgi:quinol monooxygenase YgiN